MKPFRISVVVLLVAFLWTLTGCKLKVFHEVDLTDKTAEVLEGTFVKDIKKVGTSG